MSTAPEILTVGETMLALRCEGLIRLGAPMRTSIAGAESTVAIGLARLGHRSGWLGRVGADESGALVLRTLRAEGVDVGHVVRDDDAGTGLILFEQRLPDVTRVQYHRSGSAGSRLDVADVTASLADPPRVLHVSGITPALSATARAATEAAIAAARAGGTTVSLDVNFRSRLWSAEQAAPVLRPLAEQADVVIASDDEVPLVADDAAELLTRGPREVVVKHGADGAAVVTGDGVTELPAHRVGVVDSVGAGDAFCAGYLSGVLDGLPVEQRLARANALGAFAVSTSGDWEGLPTRDELALVGAAAGTTLR